MLEFLFPFVLFTLFIGFFSFLIHYYSSRLWVRVAGVAVFLIALPIGWWMLDGALSKPKPIEITFIESIKNKDVYVLKVLSIKDEGIYLWVLPKGERVPKSYVLPWDKKMAERMRRQMQSAKRNKTAVIMKGLFKMRKGEINDSKGAPIIVPMMPVKTPNDRKVLLNKANPQGKQPDTSGVEPLVDLEESVGADDK